MPSRKWGNYPSPEESYSGREEQCREGDANFGSSPSERYGARSVGRTILRSSGRYRVCTLAYVPVECDHAVIPGEVRGSCSHDARCVAFVAIGLFERKSRLVLDFKAGNSGGRERPALQASLGASRLPGASMARARGGLRLTVVAGSRRPPGVGAPGMQRGGNAWVAR